MKKKKGGRYTPPKPRTAVADAARGAVDRGAWAINLAGYFNALNAAREAFIANPTADALNAFAKAGDDLGRFVDRGSPWERVAAMGRSLAAQTREFVALQHRPDLAEAEALALVAEIAKTCRSLRSAIDGARETRDAAPEGTASS